MSTNSSDCEDSDNEEKSFWWRIPEEVLLNILLYLTPIDAINVGKCCKRWENISRDDYIWKRFFHHDFNINNNIGLKPGAGSWRGEYKRLTYHVPMVLTDVLTTHSHQVLHVSFSHNGKMFSTCSKDGYVNIWNASYPSTIKYSHNMKDYSWKYTQFSQFNISDTLLLVSGVHFGSPHSTSGEIAVFSVINGSRLKCRVVNRPYDIFGTWFSDQHLISGDLNWLAHLISTSILWLNKASQEIDSEHVPIMNQLYKFYNRNASSIRAITVASCPWLDDEDERNSLASSNIDAAINLDGQNEDHRGNPLSHVQTNMQMASSSRSYLNDEQHQPSINNDTPSDLPYHPLIENQDYASPIKYLDEYRKEYEDTYCESSIEDDDVSSDDDEDDFDDDVEIDDLNNQCPKYLIFSTGSKTYTPHQIGFKRIEKLNFPRRLDPGPSLRERIALRDRQRELENEIRAEPNWANYDSVSDRFDKVDKLIDLHGHIIGMGLSPDHRYLYVNSRPWPENYVIENPLSPPPIAQEIDIHVIDLATLKRVGNMLRAHKAYTPNTECFFIFLDVCDHYVASGAEDKHAYIWDRYYGVCLAKYQHEDVVNSVAFNPKDNEMLVTTSDDFEIKIWRSVAQAKKLGLQTDGRAVEFRKLKFKSKSHH